jgi:hypothetical protein
MVYRVRKQLVEEGFEARRAGFENLHRAISGASA